MICRFLYQPGHFPIEGFNPDSTLRDWIEEVYPKLAQSSRPEEIIQEEGQVIYIPEGWYQASLPLPHPQGLSATLSPLLERIRQQSMIHSSNLHDNDCNIGDTPKYNNNNHENQHPHEHHDHLRTEHSHHILTLSIRQSDVEPVMNTSLFFQTRLAESLIESKEYEKAISMLRDVVESYTDFTASHLLGKSILGVIDKKLTQSSSHKREEISQDLLSEGISSLKLAISLNR